MKNMAIARRYAKALLLIGKEDGRTETYKAELAGVSALIEAENELGQTLTNPLYNAANRKKVLESVIARLDLSLAMRSFLLLLFDKGRFGFLSSINDFYQKLADEIKGIARASLVSASELSSETIEKIHNGAIGDIVSLRAYWCGNLPFAERRLPGWSDLEYCVRNWYAHAWVAGDNIVEQRLVPVSRAIGDKWLVDGGLQAGDRVVVSGKDDLSDGVRVRAREAEEAATGPGAQE